MAIIFQGHHLDRYRRRARAAYPKEYLEALIGKQDLAGDIEIVEWLTCDQKMYRKSLYVDDLELQRVRGLAEERGLIYLGTVHTHPDHPGHCSETDLSEARRIGDILIGIYELHKDGRDRFHSRIHWWPNHHPRRNIVLRRAASGLSRDNL